MTYRNTENTYLPTSASRSRSRLNNSAHSASRSRRRLHNSATSEPRSRRRLNNSATQRIQFGPTLRPSGQTGGADPRWLRIRWAICRRCAA